MNETGVVKFSCERVARDVQPFPELNKLTEVHEALLELGWVGVDQNGISFGNLSVRDAAKSTFLITSSGSTGTWPLSARHFSRVTAYDFQRNWLRSEGAVVASSESLTHAAVYEAAPETHAVIHCHNAVIWQRLLNVVPTTSPNVEYGTPAMAAEVSRLFATSSVREEKIFVMAGHEEGIVAFGSDLADAFAVLSRNAVAAPR